MSLKDMFTGIIEDVGEIVSRSKRLMVRSSLTGEPGSSIAVNGACLTLLSSKNGLLEFEVSEETLKRTNLGSTRHVNLEKAMRFDSRVNGHFVLGHVDCISEIVEMSREKIKIKAPRKYRRCLVEKGSIAVKGISLTVSDIENNTFSTAILPYTMENTNLKFKEKYVNLEFDYLAKLFESYMRKIEKEEEDGKGGYLWRKNIAVM